MSSSSRKQIVQEILDFTINNDLCQPYGGAYEKDSNHYVIPFCQPRNLDGFVRVYSENFIQISYHSRYTNLEGGNGQKVFDSKENAINFLTAAFVEYNADKALDIPTKSNKSKNKP